MQCIYIVISPCAFFVFRFRKLKEEESRRKEVPGQAKQSEQSSTESNVLDGAQNSGSSSGDNKDEQV